MPEILIGRSHVFYSHMSFFFFFFFYVGGRGLDGNPLFKGVPSIRCLEALKARGILVSQV